MPNRIFSFVQLDVFTSRPLEGNQLAVFSDGRGLSDDEMQRLARETNLSETTFILPRDEAVEREQGHKVRIFTVSEELPFAGHPTLGTAWHLYQQSNANEIVLDLKAGKVPVRFSQREGQLFGEMRQAEPKFGRLHSPAEVAKVLGVNVRDLDENLSIQTVSTGMPFTMVAFRSLATLQRLNVSWNQMAPYFASSGTTEFFYLVCRETVALGASLHARMIFYNGEDPATGSAAGCCAAWAVQHGVLAAEQQGLIEQGMETRRPSFLYIRAGKADGVVTNVRVGGNVVKVIDGKVTM
ncbi:MAG: PhzF family phenazine biosynthesis protein [Acidobacteriota bacterium]|nr:PhzF family phenazine biosynthesis protein [Acidobacteriota bacterium]